MINPSYFEAHFNTAIAYTELKRIDLAVEEYKKLLKVNKNFIPSYINLSDIVDQEEARKLLKTAMLIAEKQKDMKIKKIIKEKKRKSNPKTS